MNTAMLGILVHGDNHFIVRGPLPQGEVAYALVRHWSLIQIGTARPSHLGGWEIVTAAHREDLEWAVILAAESEISSAVRQLLSELLARRITIQDFRFGSH